MPSLKNICMYTIMFSLNIKNCLRLLAFGDLYKAEALTETALEMVVENMGKIVETDEWKKFTKNHTELTVAVTKELISSKKKREESDEEEDSSDLLAKLKLNEK